MLLARKVLARFYQCTFRVSRPINVKGFEVASLLAPYLPGPPAGISIVSAALDLIASVDPVRFTRLRRDLRRIFVTGCSADAQYWAELDMCLLRGDVLLRKDITPAQIALTLVHEGTHARLAKAGFAYSPTSRNRHEVLCIKAEFAFASRLPEPERSWYCAHLVEKVAGVAAGAL